MLGAAALGAPRELSAEPPQPLAPPLPAGLDERTSEALERRLPLVLVLLVPDEEAGGLLIGVEHVIMRAHPT